MNRKVVFLNLALLAVAGSLVWLLRAQWLDSQARQRTVLTQRIPLKNVFSPPSPAPVKSVEPSEYIDVAQKMLFSKDRNPVVVIEAPPPKPETPMPALPQYYGQMAIGDPIVLLSVSNVQKGYHAGDQIGDFKLISFDRDTIALEWHGKKVERKVDELRPKEPAQQANPQAGAAGNTSGPVLASQPVPTPTVGVATPKPVTSLSSATTSAGAVQNPDPKLGADVGNGQRQCVDGDSSPAGTVVSGYKKTITPFMFGQICRWEPNK